MIFMAEKPEQKAPEVKKEQKPEQKQEGKEQAKPRPKHAQKQAPPPKPAGRAMPVGAKRIVRLMSTDVDGDKSLARALREIKGISFMISRAACIATGLDGSRKVAELSEQEIKIVEGFVKNPTLPAWMLNRRKDMETGRDRHITMAELDLQKRDDINMMKRIHAYKGVRHELGQPVRGQRTRTSFRTQKTVGVARKKVQQAARAAVAPAAAKKEEKK